MLEWPWRGSQAHSGSQQAEGRRVQPGWLDGAGSLGAAFPAEQVGR